MTEDKVKMYLSLSKEMEKRAKEVHEKLFDHGRLPFLRSRSYVEDITEEGIAFSYFRDGQPYDGHYVIPIELLWADDDKINEYEKEYLEAEKKKQEEIKKRKEEEQYKKYLELKEKFED